MNVFRYMHFLNPIYVHLLKCRQIAKARMARKKLSIVVFYFQVSQRNKKVPIDPVINWVNFRKNMPIQRVLT